VRTRHLRVDQHRIERGIEPKSADKPHQFKVGIARIIFTGEGKKARWWAKFGKRKLLMSLGF
jgi:hypothetical protein